VLRLVVIAAIVVLLGTLLLLGDTSTSACISDIPENTITSIQSEDDNFASATITITMYTVADE